MREVGRAFVNPVWKDRALAAEKRANHWQHQFHVMGATAAQAEAERDRLRAVLSTLETRWVMYARNAGAASVDAVFDAASSLKDRMAGENRAWHTAVEELRAALAERSEA